MLARVIQTQPEAGEHVLAAAGLLLQLLQLLYVAFLSSRAEPASAACAGSHEAVPAKITSMP